mgnify:CR=1 FL=1
MKCVVIDANIPFAALVAWEGMTQELLFSISLELISPEFMHLELDKYLPVIAEKSGCPIEEIRVALSLVLSKIRIIPFNEYEKFLPKAKKISPDPKDVEYVALALAYDCPIWSNDQELRKQQNEVKVIPTSELIKLFSKSS